MQSGATSSKTIQGLRKASDAPSGSDALVGVAKLALVRAMARQAAQESWRASIDAVDGGEIADAAQSQGQARTQNDAS